MTSDRNPTSIDTPHHDSDTASCPQVRPWIRYFARSLDLCILAGVMLLIINFLLPQYMGVGLAFLMLFILVIWIFVETLLLSTWGTTPSKWLLKTQVRNSQGNILTPSEAFQRSCSVWCFGWGLGLPIVSLFTLIFSYSKLTKDGVTRWDRKGHFVVTHQKIGFINGLIAVIVFCLYASIVSYVQKPMLAAAALDNTEKTQEAAPQPPVPTSSDVNKTDDSITAAPAEKTLD